MIHKAPLHNCAEISASLHNDLIVLKIQDDPKSWERPNFQYTDVMQDEKMMFFQYKLQYAFLSQMRKQGLQVFQTEVDIIIDLCSKQSLLNIRLEYVLKAVMDACNKHIIADDRQVRNIIVQGSTTKNQRVKADHIEIIIKDTLESQILTWSGDIFLTEKRIPISYDIGGQSSYNQKQLDYQADLHRTMTTVLAPFQSLCAGKKVSCHLRFDTLNHLNDADNMALMYLPVIRKVLLPFQDQLVSIGLYKRDGNTTGENCTTMNILLK